MDWLTIALRIVHIFGGVAWVGAAAFFFFYLEPTINKLGPDAERFVDEVINRRKAPIYFLSSSTLTVLAGVVLYLRDSGGLNAAWISSASGLAFTIGGICALIAWAGGNLLIPRKLGEIAATAGQMKAVAGPPPPDLIGRMHALQASLRTIGRYDLVLLAIAVLGMSTARYL